MGHMRNLLCYNYLTGTAVVRILFMGSSFQIMEQIGNYYDYLKGMRYEYSEVLVMTLKC